MSVPSSTVECMSLTARPMPSPTLQRPRVSHAPYRREPYVRCRAEALSADGKAVAWTRTHVLVHWIDDDGQAHNRWVPAAAVVRILRDESAWRDPYDDFGFYYAGTSAQPGTATGTRKAFTNTMTVTSRVAMPNGFANAAEYPRTSFPATAENTDPLPSSPKSGTKNPKAPART